MGTDPVRSDNINRKFLILFGFSLFALIFVSVLPGTALPKSPDGVDKLEHLVAYFLVGFFGFKAFLENKIHKPLMFFLCGVGVLLEVIHRYIPNRFYDTADMAANVAGVILAFFVVRWLRGRVKQMQ